MRRLIFRRLVRRLIGRYATYYVFSSCGINRK
jgi:hypothetical protein